MVAVDYVTKWTEAEALKEKTALAVSEFLYKVICRHSCFKIQINDQGREFVNSVSSELHRLTGVEQRVTSAYHPQANGLVERQNRTIKTALQKVLLRDKDWPQATDGVLFAHRTTKHASTGFSPFFLLYNREPRLPIDVEYAIRDEEPTEEEALEEAISKKLKVIEQTRNTVYNTAAQNIELAQKKQCKDFNRRQTKTQKEFKVGMKVLLRNLRRDDRKGGKLAKPWKGPFEISNLFSNNTCTLRRGKHELKSKQHLCNIKHYAENPQEQTEVDITDVSHYRPPVPVVSEKDRAEICANIGLTMSKTVSFGCFDLNGVPRRIHIVQGDGNCFFRAISFILTGSEDKHIVIRNKIVHHMTGPAKAEIENYTGKDISVYVKETKIDENATWATDVEILGAASCLGRDIYVYSKHGTEMQWLQYPASFVNTVVTKTALFLANVSGNHFNVVLSSHI